jgi:hypothetical protein
MLVSLMYIATSPSSGPNAARVSFSSPEHGKQIHFPKRCFFWVFWNTGQREESRSPVFLSVLHCRQNPFGSTGSGRQT